MKGRPFQPGNKMGKGRPPGSRNKRSVFAELMDGRGESIITMCQVMAMEKDPTAMRLCMERLLPPRKAANHRFHLAEGTTAANLVTSLETVLQNVARGKVTAQEGESMARIIESQRRMMETEVFERRLQTQEKEMEKLRLQARRHK